MSRWNGATPPPTVKRKPCPLKCGAHVDTFTTEYGRVVHLDVTPPSTDIDLAAVRDRLYEYRGSHIGWVPKFLPERTWRELRLMHECASTSTSTRKR